MTLPVVAVDLAAAHAEIADEVEPVLTAMMRAGAVLAPEAVAAFEREYASFCGVRHMVGVSCGTDALELALRAVGVGPGDEVVLPTNAFVSTAAAVVRAGATPVLVDCDPATHLIDVEQAIDAFGPRTRAVVPVHLHGQVAAVEELLEAAERAGVVVVEDAAQSHGARRHGRGAGTFGAVAATSFHTERNLGAYGDAGGVLTDSPEVARAVRLLAGLGGEQRHRHATLGFASRLDGLQAVVLSAKLRRLARWNEDRRAAAGRYRVLLGALDDVRLPRTLEGNDHVWHHYVVRVPVRDVALKALLAAGIAAAVHHPVPLHLHGAFTDLGYRYGDLPVAEALAGEVLSLPLHPHLRPADQERVVAVLRESL